MKTKLIILLSAFAILGLVATDLGTQPNLNTKEVMRFKLRYAQSVLEGIATENFALIRTNAQ